MTTCAITPSSTPTRRWIETWVAEIGENAKELRPEQMINMSRNWAAGGGYGLVGTPDMILDKTRSGCRGPASTA